MTSDQETILAAARRLGYSTVNFNRPTAGRGRAPVNIDALMAELFEYGFEFDACWAPGTPFLGDPHPENPSLLLWNFSDAGFPHYVPRSEFIYELRRALQRYKRANRATGSEYALKAKIHELELRLQAAKAKLHQYYLRKSELRTARRVVDTGRPATVREGVEMSVEDARWVLDHVKTGRPLDSQPSKQALYMRQYRERKRQEAQNHNPTTAQ
jgi:hypothetical protein